MRGRVAALKQKYERSRVSATALAVRDERLTYLSYRSFRNLERCLRRVERERVPGDLIETGVALGGSSVVIARTLSPGRRFHAYDVFGQIPPTSEKDDEKARARYEVIAGGKSVGIKGDPYYGYMDDLLERVTSNMTRFGVAPDGDRIVLHKGLFEDTLHPEAVAFAHLDGDWYESTTVSLERIYPVLSPGGFMVVDDYHNYGGCTRAVNEFLAAVDDVGPVWTDRRPDRTTNLVLRRARR